MQVRKVCIKSARCYYCRAGIESKNIIMSTRSSLLEVSYGVHNHQTGTLEM